MHLYPPFDFAVFLKTGAALLTAFILGGLIGFERQWRQRTAGLRTNVLVAIGSAAFVDLGMRVAGTDGSVRVISYVVSGIGFLGAGVIMKEGTQVRGINTSGPRPPWAPSPARVSSPRPCLSPPSSCPATPC